AHGQLWKAPLRCGRPLVQNPQTTVTVDLDAAPPGLSQRPPQRSQYFNSMHTAFASSGLILLFKVSSPSSPLADRWKTESPAPTSAAGGRSYAGLVFLAMTCLLFSFEMKPRT